MSLVKKYTRLWFIKVQVYLGLSLMPYEAIGQPFKFAVYQIHEIISFQFLYILSPCFNLSGHSLISTVTKENTNCPYIMVHIILISWYRTMFRYTLVFEREQPSDIHSLFDNRLKKCLKLWDGFWSRLFGHSHMRFQNLFLFKHRSRDSSRSLF